VENFNPISAIDQADRARSVFHPRRKKFKARLINARKSRK
jgi:hypothetical protein